jgi:hypothetical protein
MGHLRKNYPVKLVDLKKKRIAKRTNRKAGGERRKDSKDHTVSRHGRPEENGLVHAEVEEEISEESIESAEPPLEVIALNSAITFFRCPPSFPFVCYCSRRNSRPARILSRYAYQIHYGRDVQGCSHSDAEPATGDCAFGGYGCQDRQGQERRLYRGSGHDSFLLTSAVPSSLPFCCPGG